MRLPSHSAGTLHTPPGNRRDRPYSYSDGTITTSPVPRRATRGPRPLAVRRGLLRVDHRLEGPVEGDLLRHRSKTGWRPGCREPHHRKLSRPWLSTARTARWGAGGRSRRARYTSARRAPRAPRCRNFPQTPGRGSSTTGTPSLVASPPSRQRVERGGRVAVLMPGAPAAVGRTHRIGVASPSPPFRDSFRDPAGRKLHYRHVMSHEICDGRCSHSSPSLVAWSGICPQSPCRAAWPWVQP
jgi:hypothetical protein